MVARCILLIEDQAEIRRMLRQSLFYLEQGMRIIEMPSGEEALLVLSRQTVDLAIVDVRLAGISGLDFLKRARQRQPGLKVILMTGMTDLETRRQLAGAGAEAYFFKPLEMPAFIQAIKRCLGEPQSEAPAELEALEKREAENEVPAELERQENPDPVQIPLEEPTFVPDLRNLLEELRLKSGVDVLLLLGNQQEVLGTAGSLPGGMDPTILVPPLAALLSTSVQLSSCLGETQPSELISFRGAPFDLHLAQAGSWGYLAAFSAATSGLCQEKRPQEISQTAAELALYCGNQAGTPPSGETRSQEKPEAKGDTGPHILEEDPAILVLFSQSGEPSPDSRSLDAFWEEAALQEKEDLEEAGRLTFEQARQLGLAPDG